MSMTSKEFDDWQKRQRMEPLQREFRAKLIGGLIALAIKAAFWGLVVWALLKFIGCVG